MAKHRAPRYVRTKKALARVPVAAGATAVGLGVLSSPAQAAATHDWTGVAQCESGGNWGINTGNGYYGGLQFHPATWTGFGGGEFAPRADLATPAQQVEIAEKVLAGQGIGAWPTCGKHLTSGTTPAAATAPAPEAAQPITEADPADGPGRHAAPAGGYTVERGDTLRKIAAAHGEKWRELYQRNLEVIGSNPNMIFPGQVLVTDGAVRTAQEAPQAPEIETPEIETPEIEAPEAVAAAEASATVEPQDAPAPAPAAPEAPAPAPAAPEAPAPAAVVTEAPTPAPAAPALTASSPARISNTAGDVRPAAQAAADDVVANVPGVADLTIGGTRASAADPHGHPSGLALDYMVHADAALGDAIVAYHLAHWDELGVEYVIWQQRILSSPTGSWKQMEDRGSATANHFDHVHVNHHG